MAQDRGSPTLTLAAAVRGAWQAHLLGLVRLTAPPGSHPSFSAMRLGRENGMRPWLRLALGDDAERLERSGRAAWHAGAMMGEADGCFLPPHESSLLRVEPGEMASIRLVELLCEDGQCSNVHFMLSTATARSLHVDVPLRPRTPFLDGLLALDRREYEECRGYCKDSMVPWFETLLRAMASSCGLDLDSVELGATPWEEREAEAVVVSRTPARYAVGGGILYEESLLVRIADGAEWTLVDSRFQASSPYPRYGARPGQRLVLGLRGCTGGHKGYVHRVESMEDARFRREMAARRELDAIMERHRDEELAGCVSGDGIRLGKGMQVVLDCDCLEAVQGTPGEVRDVLGTMAMVKFQGRRRQVPCYGHALLAA